MATSFIIGWLIFVVLVYCIAWLDYAYYEYDLPNTYRQIIEAFTEEE